MNYSSVDWIFIGTFLALLVILIIFLIVKKIGDNKANKIVQEELAKLTAEDSNVIIEETETVIGAEAEDNTPEVVPVATKTEEVEPEIVETVEEPVVEATDVEESAEEVEPEVDETIEEPVVENVEEHHKGRTYDGKYEVYQENNYYRYRLKASNGEILFDSEMYSSRLTAIKAIDNFKRNITTGKTEIFVDKKKNYKFKLTAANNRVMAISANYSSEKGAQSALESLKRFANTNDIVDVQLPPDQIDSQFIEISKIKEEDKKGAKFVIRKDNNKEFSWELKANNGEILCQQGGYTSKSSVENAIITFKENVTNGKFYLSKDKSGNYQFKLYSQSGRLASVGESYDSSNAVFSVVTSILNFADLAVISDTTKSSSTKKTGSTAKKTSTRTRSSKK